MIVELSPLKFSDRTFSILSNSGNVLFEYFRPRHATACRLWTASGGVHALLVLEQTDFSTSTTQAA